MKTVIEMARSVGATAYTNRHYPDRPTHTFNVDQLERFAEIVRADAIADEREACAKVCDDLHPGLATKRAAEIIRARSNT
jgi:hypothetical protein